MRSIVACISLLTLGSLSCQATEVVAIRTDTFVVIGADSRINLETTGYVLGDKIFEVGDGVVGIANLYNDPNLKLNYIQIVKQALSDASIPIDSRVSRMENIVQEDLIATVRFMRINVPEKYEEYRHKPLLSVIVTGIDSTVPYVYCRVFFTDERTNPVSVRIVGGYSPRNAKSAPAIFAIGSTTQLAKYLASHPGYDKTLNQALDTVCGGIEAEIKAVPEMLGPPIRMVVLDSKGIHWQQPRDEHCQKK